MKYDLPVYKKPKPELNIGAKIEYYLPLFISILSIFISYYFFNDILYYFNNSSETKDIINIYVNMASIVVGFLTTSATILLSLTSNRIIKIIQKHEAIHRLTSFLIKPIIIGLINIIILIILLSLIKTNGIIMTCFIYISISLSAYFIISALRIIIVLCILFKNVLTDFDKSICIPQEQPQLKDENIPLNQ